MPLDNMKEILLSFTFLIVIDSVFDSPLNSKGPSAVADVENIRFSTFFSIAENICLFFKPKDRLANNAFFSNYSKEGVQKLCFRQFYGKRQSAGADTFFFLFKRRPSSSCRRHH